MKGSWYFTTLAGIDVSLHWSFGLLMLYVAATAGFTQLIFVLMLFGCVVLHELGHALAARSFGIATRGITLLPIGGVAHLERIPRNPWQELVIALAGPAVNVGIAAVLFAFLSLGGGVQQAVSSLGAGSGALLPRLLVVNLALVVFNLIPAFPMDGGRVLRSMLALITDYPSATRWAVRTGQFVACLLAVLGVGYNPMLLLIAAFVVFAAEAELRHVLAEDQFRNRVRADLSDDVVEGQVVASRGGNLTMVNPTMVEPMPSQSDAPITATLVWPDSPASTGH
ncbi:MAG: hypothetical protein GY768_26230 [Planctomycetaceae bacterium]|nr:hypothetical protein [Planctomycetaceae bacterium]